MAISNTISEKIEKPPLSPEIAQKNADTEKRLKELSDAYDAKEATKLAESKIFDPMELVQEASAIYEIKDAVLGTVKYGKLSLKEFKSFDSIKAPEERGYHILHLMLQKAYPALTYENVESMLFDKIARLSDLLSKEVTRFLPKRP